MQRLLGPECLRGTVLLQARLLRRLAGLQTLHVVAMYSVYYYYCTAPLTPYSPGK